MINDISDQRFLLGVPATASVTCDLSGLAKENGLYSMLESTVIPEQYVITFKPQNSQTLDMQERELNAVLLKMREWNPGSMRLYEVDWDKTQEMHAFLDGYLGRAFGGGVDLVICDITGRVIAGDESKFIGKGSMFSIYSAGQKCFKPNASQVQEIAIGEYDARIYSALLPRNPPKDVFTAPTDTYLIVGPHYTSPVSRKKIAEAIVELDNFFLI